MILDDPCEIEGCKAPVELYEKVLDLKTQKWIGIFTCLNKHTYKKQINISGDPDADFWNIEAESPIWEDSEEEFIQDELPFFEGTEE